MSGLNDCILVVEDEFIIADYLTLQLEEMGHTVCGVADTAEKAVSMARNHQPRLVLMDVRLKGAVDGIDAALAIHHEVGSKAIIVTGSREPANLERIKRGHAVAVLFKPLQSGELEKAVSLALS